MQTGDLNVLGDLCAGGYQLIYDSGQLAASASQVNISGLNGNVDREYMLVCNHISGVNTSQNLLLSPNGHLAAAYGYQNMSGTDAITGAGRNATLTGLIIGANNYINEVGFSKTTLKAKSGTVRTAITSLAWGITSTSVTSVSLWGSAWIDTSANITSLQINPDQAGGIGSKSHIMLFRRTPSGSDSDATGSRQAIWMCREILLRM